MAGKVELEDGVYKVDMEKQTVCITTDSGKSFDVGTDFYYVISQA